MGDSRYAKMRISESQNTNPSEEFGIQKKIEDMSFAGNPLGEHCSERSTAVEMDKSEINPILQNTDQSKEPMEMSEDVKPVLYTMSRLFPLCKMDLKLPSKDLEECLNNLRTLNKGNDDIICELQNLLKATEQEVQQEEKKFDINCDKNSIPNVIKRIDYENDLKKIMSEANSGNSRKVTEEEKIIKDIRHQPITQEPTIDITLFTKNIEDISTREQWENNKKKFINREMQRQMITNVNEVGVEMTNINDKKSELRKQYEYLQFIVKEIQDKTNRSRVEFEMGNKRLEQYKKKLEDVESMLQETNYCITNLRNFKFEMLKLNDKKNKLRSQYEYLQSIAKENQDKTNKFGIDKKMEQYKENLEDAESMLQQIINIKTFDVKMINFNDKKSNLKRQYEYFRLAVKVTQDKTNKFRSAFEIYNKELEQYKKKLEDVESMLQQMTNAKTFNAETINQSSEVLNMRPQLITQQSGIDIALSKKSVQLIKSVREQLDRCKEDLKFINSMHQQIITNMDMAIDEMTNIPNKLNDKENELTMSNTYLMSLIKKNQDEINKLRVECKMHRNNNKSDVEQKISTCTDSLMQETADTKKKSLEKRELEELELQNKQRLKMIKEFWRNQENALIKRQKYEKENQKIPKDKKLKETDVQFKIKQRLDMAKKFCRCSIETHIKHPKSEKKHQKTLEERKLKEETSKFENEQRLKMDEEFYRNKDYTLIKRRESENENQKIEDKEYDSNMQKMKKRATFHTRSKSQQRFKENQILPTTNEVINKNAKEEPMKYITKVNILKHLISNIYDNLEKDNSSLLSLLKDKNSKTKWVSLEDIQNKNKITDNKTKTKEDNTVFEEDLIVSSPYHEPSSNTEKDQSFVKETIHGSFNTLTSQNSILQEKSQQASSEINSKSSDLQILMEQVPKVSKSYIDVRMITWEDVEMEKGDYKHIMLPTINTVDTEMGRAMKSPKQVNTVSDINSVMNLDTNYIEATENISNKTSAKIVKLSEDPKINDKSTVMDEQVLTFTENLNKDCTTSVTQKERNDGKCILISPINVEIEEIEEAEESAEQTYEGVLSPLKNDFDEDIQAVEDFTRAIETLNSKSTKWVSLEDIQNKNEITDNKTKTKEDDTVFEDLIISLPYYEPSSSNTAKDQSFVKETIHKPCQSQPPDDYQFENCSSHVKLDNTCASQRCKKTLMSNGIDTNMSKNHVKCDYCYLASDILMTINYDNIKNKFQTINNNNKGHECTLNDTDEEESEIEDVTSMDSDTSSCETSLDSDRDAILKNRTSIARNTSNVTRKTDKNEKRFYQNTVEKDQTTKVVEKSEIEDITSTDSDTSSTSSTSSTSYETSFNIYKYAVLINSTLNAEDQIMKDVEKNKIEGVTSMDSDTSSCETSFDIDQDAVLKNGTLIAEDTSNVARKTYKDEKRFCQNTVEDQIMKIVEENEIEGITSTDSDTSSCETSLDIDRDAVLKNGTLIAEDTSNVARKTYKDEKRFCQNTVEDQIMKIVEENEIEGITSMDSDTSSCETSLDIDRDAVLKNGTLIAEDTSNVARKTYKDEERFDQNIDWILI